MSTGKSSVLGCISFREYLLKQNPTTLEKLYVEPATCLALFRELPPLGKLYVMRLLFVEQPIFKAVVNSWVKQNHVKEHTEAMTTLNDLRIWSESPLPGGLPGLLLSNIFRAGLKTALMGGGRAWSIKPTTEKDKHARDISFLDSYAMERWECILHFMVGSKSTSEAISMDTIQTLVKAGLTKYEGPVTKEASPAITAEGFQFLLMDTYSQVWYFVLQYIENIESKGLSLVESLSFLFQLSFLTLGKVYSTDSMTEPQSSFLQNLRELGLIYQRKVIRLQDASIKVPNSGYIQRKDGRFYPTKLIINLTKGNKEMKLASQHQSHIIVETNFRVYAYTDSPLQIALLALFTDMQYRFPKFCLGVLTRDSVRVALRHGLTAEQIVNFLKMHSHPVVSGKQPQIPATVMDQIKLWELERERLLDTEGVLYSQFLSQGDFELLRTYANDAGYLIWDNPTKRVMVVSPAGHDDVRRFWKRHKKEH